MSENEDFFDECLREHNIIRKKHKVGPLRHSIALDRTAQEWAENLLQKDNVKNSPLSSRGELGESISKRTSTNKEVEITGIDVITQWYNDINCYKFDTGEGAAGNFTQMVWANTREVGFGKARAPGQCVVVAHYRPPGNIRGHYIENVFPVLPDENADNNFLTDIESETTTKRTVVKDKKVDSQGQEYTVLREIIETKDAKGNIHRKVLESFDNSNTNHNLTQLSFNQTKDSLQEFIHNIVVAHNQYRKLHNAGDLVTNSRLSMMAQEWAEYLVEEICLSNSGFTIDAVRLGENITSRWSNGVLDESAKEVVDNWYQESSRFKYGVEPISIQGIGNFTQLVWASSKSIGVGRAIRVVKAPLEDASLDSTSQKSTRLSSKTVVVCFYFPPGNTASYFNENVHLPQSTSNESTPSFSSRSNFNIMKE